MTVPRFAFLLTFAERLMCHLKILNLNLALTLGCLNPKNLNPNPDPNSNPIPNNCGYESN